MKLASGIVMAICALLLVVAYFLRLAIVGWILDLFLPPQWIKTEVTYSFANCPSTLDCQLAHQAVRQALQKWDVVSGLTLSEVRQDGDLLISWVPESDLLLHPAESEYQLAEGLLPNDFGLEALDGDVHFNDNKLWKVASPEYHPGFNLEIIALHEIGHSLGLQHDERLGSIMNSTARTLLKAELGPTDIAAIQAIYGGPND